MAAFEAASCRVFPFELILVLDCGDNVPLQSSKHILLIAPLDFEACTSVTMAMPQCV